MILDKIVNGGKYAAMSARFAKAFEMLTSGDLGSKEDGKYEVDGDSLFYLIQRYPTRDKDEMLFEAHKNYIDIQAIIDGQETIGYALTEILGEAVQPYKPDVAKYADPPVFTEVRLAKGMFAILYPDDAHKPCYDYGPEKSNVHKLVVKVKI